MPAFVAGSRELDSASQARSRRQSGARLGPSGAMGGLRIVHCLSCQYLQQVHSPAVELTSRHSWHRV
jgi:hypothetical protein